MQKLGINKIDDFHRNLTVKELINHIVQNDEGRTGLRGAAMIDTGIYTGRSPNDKYIVDEASSRDKIWWGQVNRKVDENVFDDLYKKVINYYNMEDSNSYVFDGFAGADKTYSINVRIIAKKAWQAHFAHNMFIRPDQDELKAFEPDFTIINASDVQNKDFQKHGLNSKTFVLFHIGRRIAIIGGTEYGGEMKKGIFSVLHYLLPQQGVLSMHCSANTDKNGNNAAIFFGLSGTGKTTLSTDPNRPLIGDDEHGWSDDGIFNFEGGCYAKAINLDKEKEPEIYNAIKHGTLLENVVYDLETKEVDFDDNTKSENSRICYPINFVENSLGSKDLKSAGPHPNSIIFLTCDAYGIMPPLARMTKKQAMYHFISGYTAKMAGTETGVTEPVAAFSPCYGGPFLTLHPLRYAELLEKKLNDYNSSVYLVNTGWSGSSATSGSSRIDLKLTKHIINLITDGTLDFSKSVFDKFFNLEIPLDIEGLDNEFLVPHLSWDNLEEYFSTGNMLTRLFNNNFEIFKIKDSDILSAGPKTDLST